LEKFDINEIIKDNEAVWELSKIPKI